MGGSSNTIKVDTDVIARTVTVINSKISTYEGHYKTIYQHLEDIALEWKGSDFDRFRDRLKEFEGDFIDLHNKLDDYVRFLNKAIEEYETAQTNLTQSAGRLAADR